MEFKVPKGVDKIPKTVKFDESDCEIMQKLADENKKSFNEVVNIMVKYADDFVFYSFYCLFDLLLFYLNALKILFSIL